MRKIKVIVDSCSSLTKELAVKLDVYVIPTSFSINNHDYKTTDEDLLTYDEFYELLEKKEHSKKLVFPSFWRCICEHSLSFWRNSLVFANFLMLFMHCISKMLPL